MKKKKIGRKKKKSRNNITLKNIRELPKGVIMGTTVGIMKLFSLIRLSLLFLLGI